MRRGQGILADLPWVGQWAELAVLAHLTGWPAPVPRPAMLAALLAQPARLVQCALSHSIDAAVAARPEIARPAAFAAHVAAAISARLAGAAWQCRPDEPEWLLGPEAAQALELSGTLDGLPEAFIDCQWPSLYLRR